MAASFETRVKDALTAAGGRDKLILTLLSGNLTSIATLKTTNKSSILAAVNELFDRASGAGTGDMSKATYDTNNDGIVDRAALADSVAWGNVSGKPSTYPASPMDASNVTSGVFDIARIPVVPSQVQIVSAGAIAALTSGQQAQIGQGTVVTTTDGRRWIYSGSGSKTAEASYVEMADVTPEWTVIANKPTTLAGYGITDAWTKTEMGNPDADLVAVYQAAL